MSAYPPLDAAPACDGSLTINGINLLAPSWRADPRVLWSTPDRRGANRTIPGISGRRAYRRRTDGQRHSIPILVTGFYDSAGVLSSTPMTQLQTNVAYLHANVVADPGTSTGLVTAVWHTPAGSDVTAQVQVLGMPVERLVGYLVRGTLEIDDVNGALGL